MRLACWRLAGDHRNGEQVGLTEGHMHDGEAVVGHCRHLDGRPVKPMIPSSAARNHSAYMRALQSHGAMFNRKMADGHANINSADADSDDDGGMHFRMADGGAVEFVHNTTGMVLASIKIADGG